MESAVDVFVDSKHAAIHRTPTIGRLASGQKLNAT
jgi:hypothetical protein